MNSFTFISSIYLEEIMAKHIKRSVVPIYLVGVTWLVQATVFSLYTLSDYVFCIMACVIVFVLAKMVFPDKEYTLKDEKEQQPEKQEKPKKEKEPSKEPKTESAGEGEAAKKNPGRRPNHRRRSQKKPAGNAE